MKKIIQTENAPKPAGPYSQGIQVDKFLFVSGQLAIDPKEGKIVANDIKGQTVRVMENIKAVLERNGSSLDRVVKCTAMLADMSEWGAMNQVYASYFPTHLPARSAFGATGLVGGARLELECWATVQ